MIGRITRSIVLRFSFCVILAVAMWCRGQVADDKVYVQWPGVARLDVENQLSGVELELTIAPNNWAFSPTKWFGSEGEPKYRTLWRHVYFSAIGQLWDFTEQGIKVYSDRETGRGTFEVGVEIPHALLAILLFILADWETAFRKRRRYAPGHCQNCGYDVRGNATRCSECGIEFKPSEVVKSEGRIRRNSRRLSATITVGVLALHASIGLLGTAAGHVSPGVHSVDASLFKLLQFPVGYSNEVPLFPDPLTAVVLGAIILINCFFWGWIFGWAAWLAMMATRRRLPKQVPISLAGPLGDGA